MASLDVQAEHDESLELEREFGYPHELRRSLRQFSIWAVSFSVLAITTGIYLNYGFGLSNAGPVFVWTWPVVVFGQFLVALVFADLSGRIPLTGYAYQWSSRLVNPTLGWFVGFFSLMFLLVGGAAIAFELFVPVVGQLFGFATSSGVVSLGLSIGLIALVTLITCISVRVTSRVNNVAVFTDVAGALTAGVIVLVVWLFARPAPIHHSLGFLLNTGGLSGGKLAYGLMLALLMGCFTLTGFETAADLSEEAVNARITVPRAIIGSLLIAGVLGFLLIVGVTLAMPSLHATQASTNPIPLALQYTVGGAVTKFYLSVLAITTVGLVTILVAAAGRVFFAMSRDNMLPASHLLRRVDRETGTPVLALVTAGIITAGLVVYGFYSSASFGILVGGTAVFAFLVYFGAVASYTFVGHRVPPKIDRFSLGSWTGPVKWGAFVWLVAALLVLTVPSVFRNTDWVVLICAGLAVVWYATVLRGRLASGTAGARTSVTAVEEPRVVSK